MHTIQADFLHVPHKGIIFYCTNRYIFSITKKLIIHYSMATDPLNDIEQLALLCPYCREPVLNEDIKKQFLHIVNFISFECAAKYLKEEIFKNI